MADEARIEQTREGALVASSGWFVLNMAEVAWWRDASARGGEWSGNEPPDGFEQYGIGIHVLHPGQMNGLYHSESDQEDFLVLSGECILVIEEEERRLQAWDFVHCSPGTRHIFVGAGDGPCAILMVGTRSEGKTLHYPPSEIAARHGASVALETSNAREAYRDWPRDFEQVRATWPPA
jgi:uncharacterized cupin superfamily protein